MKVWRLKIRKTSHTSACDTPIESVSVSESVFRSVVQLDRGGMTDGGCAVPLIGNLTHTGRGNFPDRTDYKEGGYGR